MNTEEADSDEVFQKSLDLLFQPSDREAILRHNKEIFVSELLDKVDPLLRSLKRADTAELGQDYEKRQRKLRLRSSKTLGKMFEIALKLRLEMLIDRFRFRFLWFSPGEPWDDKKMNAERGSRILHESEEQPLEGSRVKATTLPGVERVRLGGNKWCVASRAVVALQ